MNLKFVSFNINGIQSFVSYIKNKYKKSLNNYFKDILKGDIICLQEMRYNNLYEYSSLVDYVSFYSINKKKKGYCGVSTFVRRSLYVESSESDEEGRWVLTNHGTFKVLNVYFPFLDEKKNDLKNQIKNDLKNQIKNDLKNQIKNDLKNDLKDQKSEEKLEEIKNEKKEKINFFYRFIESKTDKSTILLGDFNAVYRLEDHYQYLFELENVKKLNLEINPTIKLNYTFTELPMKFYNKKDLINHFFSVFQRKWLFDFLQKKSHKDSCDFLLNKNFTCWNTKFNLRSKNFGTRIDLILVPVNYEIQDAWVDQQVYGSDHCPVFCIIDLEVLEKENNLCNVKNNLLYFLNKK